MYSLVNKIIYYVVINPENANKLYINRFCFNLEF